MTKKAESADDLLVLARRGELSPAEQQRLRVYLQASPVSRVLYQLGAHYDSAPSACPGDARLLERLVRRASESRNRGSTRHRRGRGPLLGLVALLSSASVAVAAATVVHVAGRSTAPAPTLSTSGSTAPATAPAAARSGPRSGPFPAIASRTTNAEIKASVSTGARSPSLSARPLAARPSAAPVAGSESESGLPSAAAMFSEANTLRKSGRLGDAELAYRRLQRTHADSSEAAVSHVLLGRILLQRGQAQAACSEFDRYLGGNNRGSLAEEALQGQAMALRALGRRSDERAVWESVLARFPGSIYAGAARERLEELAGAPRGPGSTTSAQAEGGMSTIDHSSTRR